MENTDDELNTLRDNIINNILEIVDNSSIHMHELQFDIEILPDKPILLVKFNFKGTPHGIGATCLDRESLTSLAEKIKQRLLTF